MWHVYTLFILPSTQNSSSVSLFTQSVDNAKGIWCVITVAELVNSHSGCSHLPFRHWWLNKMRKILTSCKHKESKNNYLNNSSKMEKYLSLNRTSLFSFIPKVGFRFQFDLADSQTSKPLSGQLIHILIRSSLNFLPVHLLRINLPLCSWTEHLYYYLVKKEKKKKNMCCTPMVIFSSNYFNKGWTESQYIGLVFTAVLMYIHITIRMSTKQ